MKTYFVLVTKDCNYFDNGGYRFSKITDYHEEYNKPIKYLDKRQAEQKRYHMSGWKMKVITFDAFKRLMIGKALS